MSSHVASKIVPSHVPPARSAAGEVRGTRLLGPCQCVAYNLLNFIGGIFIKKSMRKMFKKMMFHRGQTPPNPYKINRRGNAWPPKVSFKKHLFCCRKSSRLLPSKIYTDSAPPKNGVQPCPPQPQCGRRDMAGGAYVVSKIVSMSSHAHPSRTTAGGGDMVGGGIQ